MGSKKKILCIDDEDAILSILEEGLGSFGYKVFCASNQEKALKVLDKENPDVIIMDIMMPDIDGITFTREIHADPKTEHIPIVICSGLDDPATLNDAMLFGAVDYLVKPIGLDALKSKIEKAIEIGEKRKKKA